MYIHRFSLKKIQCVITKQTFTLVWIRCFFLEHSNKLSVHVMHEILRNASQPHYDALRAHIKVHFSLWAHISCRKKMKYKKHVHTYVVILRRQTWWMDAQIAFLFSLRVCVYVCLCHVFVIHSTRERDEHHNHFLRKTHEILTYFAASPVLAQ